MPDYMPVEFEYMDWSKAPPPPVEGALVCFDWRLGGRWTAMLGGDRWFRHNGVWLECVK